MTEAAPGMQAAEPPSPQMVLSEAKLAPPRARAGVIPRPRLFAELDRLRDTELTLVSAAAGSGKTVAVASWLDHRPELSVGWVTLETADNDPVRLWTAVATAVDRLRPGIARPALARLRTPRSDLETAIDELLNGLAGYDGGVVIVLDDLHHVTSQAGLRTLSYAVGRLPPATRVVATTRSDPSIRLSRLRARGELGELRAADLAFTVEEVGALLAGHGVVQLEPGDVELLVERTEGWTAGIGLAGMWLSGATAPRENLREFSASNRHVTDYLTSEVLDTLDDRTRGFLLRTSVLGRFTAELCDDVLQADDSDERLAALERSNLFIVPLDGSGRWYRYHNLFRELLLAELASADPAAEAQLHTRAARWFTERGLLEDALEHAWRTGDAVVLAELLEVQHLVLIRAGRVETFMSWVARVPERELAERPLLAAVAALTSGLLAQPSAIRRRYAALAEARRGMLPEAQRIYVDTVTALTRGGLLDEDLDVCVAESARAADLALAYVHELTVPTLAELAYGHYLAGDLDLARAAADRALERPEAPRSPHGLVQALAVHALLECDAGRSDAADQEARYAVSKARELELAGMRSGGVAHHALGEALLARGHARDAERELERAWVLRHAGEPRLDVIHSLIRLASARIARGRLTLAAAELRIAREQLTAFADAGRLPAMADAADAALADALAGQQHTVEPPSPAELSILQLLGTDLTQREIGDELFLSLNTVKSHSRSLYAKLGAHSREEAVRAAAMLGLIDQPDSTFPGSR